MATGDSVKELARVLAPVFTPHGGTEPVVEAEAEQIARCFPEHTGGWQITVHDPPYLMGKLGLEPTESEVMVIDVAAIANDGHIHVARQPFIIEVIDDQRAIYTRDEWAQANA